MNPESTGRSPWGLKVVVNENEGDDTPGMAMLR
jgi:hypothetical protein